MQQFDTTRPRPAPHLDLPSGWRLDAIELEPIKPLLAPSASVEAALADPLNSPHLNELAGPGDHVCVAFPDPTALCPDHILVPALLRELEQAGVHDQDITLLCASGPHGRTSLQQKVAMLGAEVAERYRVLDHNVGEVVHAGQWRGIPLTVNRGTLEADLLIATGVVAPDLYAGYSGGADTVAIGCAGEATLEALHSPDFLQDTRVRPGRILGNPLQEAMYSVTQRTGLRFVLNAILDPTGQIVDVQAGDPFLVHQHLVFSASSMYNRPVPQIYDAVIADLTPPHEDSLYQAILGALFASAAVRAGGVILLPARTSKAAGEVASAKNFYCALSSTRSLDALTDELWERGCRPGEARAFQLAQLLEQNEVIVIGSEFPEIVEACHLQAAADMEEAIDMTRWLLGNDLDVLSIPHALHTIPIPPTREWDNQVGVSLADMWTC